MAKKNKFNLTNLAHASLVKEGDKLMFVSDPAQACTVHKLPNHEYKVKTAKGEETTVHIFVQTCLGQEPPDHASKWLRNESGKTLYDLWQQLDANED